MDTPTRWTFFTNHAHVLFCLSTDPTLRIKDLAEMVGITERATQRILSELVRDGYVHVQRVGRRNSYHITAERPLRHPVEAHHRVDELIDWINHGRSLRDAALGLEGVGNSEGSKGL